MRERRKSLNGKSYRLALQALTPALSRREREFTCFCDSLWKGEGNTGLRRNDGQRNIINYTIWGLSKCHSI